MVMLHVTVQNIFHQWYFELTYLVRSTGFGQGLNNAEVRTIYKQENSLIHNPLFQLSENTPQLIFNNNNNNNWSIICSVHPTTHWYDYNTVKIKEIF